MTTADDRRAVEIQIGRPPRSRVVVEARCHLGLPIVIEVPPILDDGTPFPTTHWLTCPLAMLRISRIESAGGVRDADRLLVEDAQLASDFDETSARYSADRETLMPQGWAGPRPSGGVGGSRGGVKCLHAQFADTAAGNNNPIGGRVADDINPLNCSTPCVTNIDGGVARNPEWTEPDR
ncbi:MAG: DUF501 domain-containing protein [Acidimicrobiia bacterium]